MQNISSRRGDETAAQRMAEAFSRETIDALLQDAKVSGTSVVGVAARDYGDAASPAVDVPPKLPMETVAEHLTAAGMTVLGSEVVAQRSTMVEKKAWLSIPIFARPAGEFTYAQRMEVLDKAYPLTRPDAPTATSWLAMVAQRPREEWRRSAKRSA